MINLKSHLTKYHIPISNQPLKKCAQTIGILMILSILLGICMMVLTTITCDLLLIGILIADLRIFFLNVFPLFCMMALVYCITNTIWLSFMVTGVISFIVAEVNRFKMVFRDDPLIFEDVLLMSEAKEMAQNYMLYLDAVSICVLICVAIGTAFCYFNIRPKIKHGFARFGGALCAVAILFTACNTFYFNNKQLHNSMWHPIFGTEYKAGNQAMSRGVIYSFIESIPDAFVSPPESYNPEEAESILNKYRDMNIPKRKKVHMISIMLEAYNDFSKFEGVEFANDPYKNYHALEADAYSGDLFTDIFAASTIYTERQYLTGYSDMHFSKKNTPSYIWYFKSQGYSVDAMHPCFGWFYNRKNMNKYFGFDSFDYHENKYAEIPDNMLKAPRYHAYISDYDFFDYIIEGYEKAVENKEKYFNFSVTYQNHGPYPTEDKADMEYLVRKDEYTDAEYNMINNYFDGIYKTDIALQKLRDYIDNQKEPIVLTLFGDHNPRLGGENEVYKMLGINLNLDTPEGAENYYETRYVFYANAAAKKALRRDFKGEGNTISPMFLMNEYFDYVGLKGSAYMNYMSDVKKKHCVINPVYVEVDGQYVLKRELEDKETLRRQKCVEYYVKNSGIEEEDFQ